MKAIGTRNLILASIIASVALGTALGATDNRPPDETERLRADNAALWKTANRLTKENAELASEVQRLRSLLEKAGIDTRPSVNAGANQGAEQGNISQDRPKDGNTAIALAVNKCGQTTQTLAQDQGLTDIQKRMKWLEAMQVLDRVLRANWMVVSYTIENVQLNPDTGTARLECSSASIKSSDPKVPDVVFRTIYLFDIIATEGQAAMITASSKMTVAGSPALNVDFSKPAASQPAMFYSDQMPGYRPLGVFLGDSGLLSYSLMMIGEGAVVTVDGLRRTSTKYQRPTKDQGSSSDPRTAYPETPMAPKAPKPSPPVIRVEPHRVR
ncbi:MAG: hypothetical protein NTY65_02525 [Planctomycetota bacterium]|nr:hypothetical protein [Planctomycetota bacterium]